VVSPPLVAPPVVLVPVVPPLTPPVVPLVVSLVIVPLGAPVVPVVVPVVAAVALPLSRSLYYWPLGMVAPSREEASVNCSLVHPVASLRLAPLRSALLRKAPIMLRYAPVPVYTVGCPLQLLVQLGLNSSRV
jgi:hypothetical protein